jgi:hypothetical protein
MLINGFMREKSCFVLPLVVFGALGVIIFSTASGQTDSLQLAKARDASRKIYTESLGPELGLYNGVSHREFSVRPSDEGQPFFGSRDWVVGSVLYDGIFYENVRMRYDLLDDKLVIDHHYAAIDLELISQKVTNFNLGGHRFVRLVTPKAGTLSTGFYELLYDGKMKLYSRWSKSRVESISGREIQVRYEEYGRLFLFHNDVYFPVKSRASVIKLLKDKMPAVQKFIRKNKLKFHAHRAESIAKILAFYESGTGL